MEELIRIIEDRLDAWYTFHMRIESLHWPTASMKEQIRKEYDSVTEELQNLHLAATGELYFPKYNHVEI